MPQNTTNYRFSTHFSCQEPFPHDNLSHGESFHMKHVENFSTVVPVTNIRYARRQFYHSQGFRQGQLCTESRPEWCKGMHIFMFCEDNHDRRLHKAFISFISWNAFSSANYAPNPDQSGAKTEAK